MKTRGVADRFGRGAASSDGLGRTAPVMVRISRCSSCTLDHVHEGQQDILIGLEVGKDDLAEGGRNNAVHHNAFLFFGKR